LSRLGVQSYENSGTVPVCAVIRKKTQALKVKKAGTGTDDKVMKFFFYIILAGLYS
jgi:hypothetical protein